MKEMTMDSAQPILTAYKGIYRELYALCWLICGNESNAQNAMLEVMLNFRTKVTRKRAYELAKNCSLKYPPDKEALFGCLENVDRAPQLGNEQSWARRAVMLVYACDLSQSQAAKCVGKKTADVKAAIARALACMPGKKNNSERKELIHICRSELKCFAYVPDITAVRRALENRMTREAESSEMASDGRLLLSNFMAILMLLLIGFVIWAGMVMLNYFRDTAQNSAEKQAITLEEKDASLYGTD